MDSYVVLARKWRPSQFSDIGGQGPVVRTLMNAIQSNRIHHAYLLTGSRGIGKTSIARIFAKAIRCPEAKWDGQWLKSCGRCSSCTEIAAGTSVDVIEIDGASNNGVDAIREIRENAKFMPSSGTKKVYIIDEVHMVTSQAFNALLKTLEEPPPHVIFIMATTEPHKIPGTILSRCQRFDLKRFTPAQIQVRLQEVASGEGIDIEPSAQALLSRAADGSMRDALSLFDQVISFAGKKITASAVRESIGLIESQLLLGVLKGVFSREPKQSVRLIEEAYRAGHELKLLTKGIIEFLHAAILMKVGMEPSSLELSDEERKELEGFLPSRELEEIELFFQVFQNGFEWIARSPQPKLVLEVLVIKCATAEALVTLPSSSPSGSPSPTGGTKKPVSAARSESQLGPSSPPTPSTSASSNSPSAGLPKASLLFSGSVPAALKKENPQPSPVTPSRSPTLSSHRTFEGFIAHVRKSRPAIANALENSVCVSFPDAPNKEFVVAFSPEKDALYSGLLTSLSALAEFQKLTQDYFGTPRRVLVETREALEESLASKREKEITERENEAKRIASHHPIITEARALFGGELGPIEFTEERE